jgi:hypothetical protein
MRLNVVNLKSKDCLTPNNIFPCYYTYIADDTINKTNRGNRSWEIYTDPSDNNYTSTIHGEMNTYNGAGFNLDISPYGIY